MTPQPGKQGKIFWLSGPPGAGKSTTCQLMARENGYVYYEADATTSFVNPFIDLEAENPSMATMQQKPVKVALLRSANLYLNHRGNPTSCFPTTPGI